MNTYFAISCLLAFAVFVSADPPIALPLVHVTKVGSIPNPNYRFDYAVSDPSTGDHKSQWEARNGDKIRGAYSLVEPDGNVRQVEYSADSLTGFNAIVKRTGPQMHPATVPVISKSVIAAHIEHAPVIAAAPIVEEHAPVIAPAPVVEVEHTPVHEIEHSAAYHGVDITPLINHQVVDVAPFVAPVHLLPYHDPWVHLHGSSYDHKGHIARSWAAGPISLDGKTLTIKTKH